MRDRSVYFWLRRIAINLVIDTYRKQTRSRALAERLLANDAVASTVSSQPMAPDQGLIDQDARQMINDARGSLTRAMRGRFGCGCWRI